MIFVSLGTMDMPFFRMAEAVDKLAANIQDYIVVQTGYTNYEYKHVSKVFTFCTKEEMQKYIEQADLLILQGGWGAISEAMEKGKRIVVMPRHDKTEHIHDQIQLIRKLDELGCVIGVFDENKLEESVHNAYNFNFRQLKRGNAQSLIEETLNKWFLKK